MPGIVLFQRLFMNYFSGEHILLPAAAGIKNRPVTIRSGGWVINCVAYDLGAETAFELYATHPFKPDRHARFHPDGWVEELPVILQGDPGAATSMDEMQKQWDEIREQNQGLMHELSRLGLL